ncbi:hypothetical protein ACFX19_031300 [Malus domestica]
MANGIPGSNSKGKAKILISSSSSKGDGGGDRVPSAGGSGNGVPPAANLLTLDDIEHQIKKKRKNEIQIYKFPGYKKRKPKFFSVSMSNHLEWKL